MDYNNINISENAILKWRELCKNGDKYSDLNISEKIKCAIDNGRFLSVEEIICFDLILIIKNNTVVDMKRYYEVHKPNNASQVSRIFKIKGEFEYLGNGNYKRDESLKPIVATNHPKSILNHSKKDQYMIDTNFGRNTKPYKLKCKTILDMYLKMEELKPQYNDFVLDKLKLTIYYWNTPNQKYARMQTIELDKTWRCSKYTSSTQKRNILQNISIGGFSHVRIDGNAIYYKK